MARPIEATPPVTGEDAERLLRELANMCSPEEARRRIEHAKRVRTEMMRPKSTASLVAVLAAPRGR